MQLFNIEQLLKLIVDHIVKSYEKNQDRFKVIQSDIADLLASKMQSVYDKQSRVRELINVS